MIKNNILGQLLIGTIVLFLLISSIQMFGWGVGVQKVSVDEDNLTGLPKVPTTVSTTEKMTNEDSKIVLEEIAKRPLFSVDRTPFVEPEIEDSGLPTEDVPVNELKAQLTGVVITPEQSYAMILDTTTNERETYKVGMPLDGEQGGWTLNSIQSRKVVFVSDDDKKVELELEVYGQQLNAGKQSGRNKNRPKKGESSQKGDNNKNVSRDDKKKNADDIRKKIAERRAQMRAEAAKKNK